MDLWTPKVGFVLLSPRPFRVTSFLFRLRPFHLISFLLEFGRSETKCFKKGFRAVSTLVAPCVPLGLLSYYSSLLRRRRRRDLFVVSSLTCPVAGSKDPPDDAPDDPPDETPKTARNGPDPFRDPKPPQIDHPYNKKTNRIRRAAKPGNSGSGRAASRASESGVDLGASFLHFSLADRDDARSDTTRSEVNGNPFRRNLQRTSGHQKFFEKTRRRPRCPEVRLGKS